MCTMLATTAVAYRDRLVDDKAAILIILIICFISRYSISNSFHLYKVFNFIYILQITFTHYGSLTKLYTAHLIRPLAFQIYLLFVNFKNLIRLAIIIIFLFYFQYLHFFIGKRIESKAFRTSCWVRNQNISNRCEA